MVCNSCGLCINSRHCRFKLLQDGQFEIVLLRLKFDELFLKELIKFLFVQNHGELIRSFDGIFYFILKTLTTENIDLLAVTLAIIAEIAKDEYNLDILTDLGITTKISQLTNLVRCSSLSFFIH